MAKQETIVPDCGNCIHNEDCALALLGHLCPKWQSREPDPKGLDPNEAWSRGLDE
ncbi:MAG: hypothetical protein IKE25_14055 [Clostridia bacterium]|nr:hypothetical protein [Clostridia bacterium]